MMYIGDSPVSVVIQQTQNFFLDLCNCDINHEVSEREVMLLSQYQRPHENTIPSTPLVTKSPLVLLEKQDDETASTASMNPLSFDEEDFEVKSPYEHVDLDDIQLDLQNGNYRDVFRERSEPLGDDIDSSCRYAYFTRPDRTQLKDTLGSLRLHSSVSH